MAQTALARLGLATTLLVFLAACGGDDGLINIRRDQAGPDEFNILPGKPIQLPGTYTELPPPTPGGANRTDPTPEADVAVALGGSAARTQADGRVGNDGALLRQAGRYGTDPSIRPELAAADVEYRKRNRGRLLERWFGLTTYYDAYEQQSLDQHREVVRYRRAGAVVPGAPPDPVER